MIITPDGHNPEFLLKTAEVMGDVIAAGRVVNGELSFGENRPSERLADEDFARIAGVDKMQHKPLTNGRAIQCLRRTARWFLEQTQAWEDES